MPTYNDYGIVLNSTDLNETDKILNIYTKENALVRAVCKGARKPVGKFASKTDQLSCCYFQFAKGKNLDTVCDLEQINGFSKLRASLPHLSHGILFLEVVSGFAHEKENESSEVYELLYSGLDNLQSASDPEIFSIKFIIDFLSIHGFKPQLETCVSCSLEVTSLDVILSKAKAPLSFKSVNSLGVPRSTQIFIRIQVLLAGCFVESVQM